MSKKAIKTIGSLSLINLGSKLIGIFKESAIAAALGVGEAADLFVFAVKLPRALYELLADGLAAQAMLPVLAAYQGEKHAERRKEVERSFSAYFFFWIMLIWILGTILSPLITIMLGMGWFKKWQSGRDSSQVFIKAIILVCQGFPFFVTMTSAAVLGISLQLRKRFVSTAFLPFLVNLVSLFFVYVYPKELMDRPNWLILGLCVSGLCCLILQLWMIKKTDIYYWPPKWKGHLSSMRRFRKMAFPVLLSGFISQTAGLCSLSIGSFLKAGSLSSLYFSQKISEVIPSALGAGICTSLMPRLSQAYQKERYLEKSGVSTSRKISSEFYNALCTSINLTILSIVPAVIFLALFRDDLLTLFYGSTTIDTEKFALLRRSFQIYLLAAPATNLSRVFSAACFSRHDAKAPFRAGIFSDLLFLGISLTAPYCGSIMICWGHFIAVHARLFSLYLALIKKHGSPYFKESGQLLFKSMPCMMFSFALLKQFKKILIIKHLSILMRCSLILLISLMFLTIYILLLFFISGIRKKDCFIKIKQEKI